MFRQMVSPQIMLIFLPMLKSNIESSVNKKKNPEFSLSERGAHAIFQTVNITVVLMIAGDRVIQRVPRGLTWVTKAYLT